MILAHRPLNRGFPTSNLQLVFLHQACYSIAHASQILTALFMRLGASQATLRRPQSED